MHLVVDGFLSLSTTLRPAISKINLWEDRAQMLDQVRRLKQLQNTLDTWELKASWFRLKVFLLFVSGFSFTDTDDSHHSKREGTIFIPHFHFLPLTNIRRFICNFACEMNTTIFNCVGCNYRIAIPWDLPPYWITIWLTDDEMLILVRLLDDLILGLLPQLNSHQLTLLIRVNRLTKYPSHHCVT